LERNFFLTYTTHKYPLLLDPLPYRRDRRTSWSQDFAPIKARRMLPLGRSWKLFCLRAVTDSKQNLALMEIEEGQKYKTPLQRPGYIDSA